MPIIYRTTDGTKWGAGKGDDLDPQEVDDNFWNHEVRIASLETNPPTAVSISNIVVSGTQMQIQLTNGTSFGPFTLPTAVLTFRPEGFQSDATYHALDLIAIPQQGLYMARHDFTASGTHSSFNPNDVDGSGDPLYQLIFGEESYIYDFSFSYPGKPGQGVVVNDDIAEHMFLRDVYFPVNFAGSLAKLSVAPTADLVFDITNEGTTVGTLTFSAGQVSGVFVAADAVQFSNGLTLGLKKLTDTDATAKGLRIGFYGLRGLIPV